MPIVKNYDYQTLPKWFAMKKYELLVLNKQGSCTIQNDYGKIAIALISGSCSLVDNGKKVMLKTGEHYFSDTQSLQASAGQTPLSGECEGECEMMVMYGDWQEAVLSMFTVEVSDSPENPGTKTNYYRNTVFENHYHDYDECWIVYKGGGVACNEGKLIEVRAGDCVVTGIGHHHDFPIVQEKVYAIALEPEATGDKRIGHLWEHTHGPAVPRADRV